MGFEEPRESGRPQLSGLKTSGRASGDRPDLARSSKGSKTPPQSPFNRSLGFRTEPFFIGVAGGTASGKTTVCDQIMQRLHDQCVVMLSQDSFYRGLTREESKNAASINFDHPSAFDIPSMVACLEELKAMRAVNVPIYDFSTHSRSSETRRVEPADVVIIEGILVLAMSEVSDMLNMRVFVDTDDDVRLARRIQRDVADRGRDVASVIEQYTRFVKPSFDTFVAPSRRHAHVIIPWVRDENMVAIDLITEHIRMKLQQPDLRRIHHNLEVIPSNFQTRGMHTIIRNRETTTNDFVFYADRLLRLAVVAGMAHPLFAERTVVEAGLGHLPFAERTVTTPTGRPYVGVDFAKRLCGVSIIRSGESMENALRACCQGIKIGKILVHRHKPCPIVTVGSAEGNAVQKPRAADPHVPDNIVDSEEELIYEKLPADIADRHVLLLDPILATGNSAARAIQVLLERGVAECRILFLSLIAAPEGINKICSTFPRVKVITSEIDGGIGEDYQVIPGVGEFGSRYYTD